MGGGLAYLIIPLLYSKFSLIWSTNLAWRVASGFPLAICILIGVVDYFFADDSLEGDWLDGPRFQLASSVEEKASINFSSEKADEELKYHAEVIPADESLPQTLEHAKHSVIATLRTFASVIKDPTVAILVLTYACP